MTHRMKTLALLLLLLVNSLSHCKAFQTANVVLQSGLGGYSSTSDAEISTQYIASWNNNNGVFYPTGGVSYGVSDQWGSDSFRYLLRFNGLDAALPAGATILSASLTLNFINWQPSAVDVMGCFQTKTWQDTAVGPRFLGTGWAYNQYNTVCSISEAWTTPGGWDDCDPRPASITFTQVPGNTGSYTQAVNLDPLMVQLWFNDATQNKGLLFKAASGHASISGSGASVIGNRPSLSITYTTDLGAGAC